MKNRLYHMGIRGRGSRCNLANANETRNWRIYADFAQVLVAGARRIYHDEDYPKNRERDFMSRITVYNDISIGL